MGATRTTSFIGIAITVRKHHGPLSFVAKLTVPDGWLAYHLPWAAMALALMAIGPGALSLDRIIASRFTR